MILALPLLVIAFDTSLLQTRATWSALTGTLYLLCSLHPSLKRFVWGEPALLLFYPATPTLLLATCFLFLRLWKETKFLRGENERSRTSILTDLGFRLQIKVPPNMGFFFVAGAAFWATTIFAHFLNTQALAWIPFWLFATGVVSVLMSRVEFEEHNPP